MSSISLSPSSSAAVAGEKPGLSPYTVATIAWFALAFGLAVRAFSHFDHQLGSTDDAMRLFEVRQWLAGSGWYGLFTDRFNPPTGYMTHWSRLIDVPIGGMILLFERFVSPDRAEQLTLVIWPLIPLLGVFLALTRIAERLGGSGAPVLMIAAAISAVSVHFIFAPGEIDHHNVQLMLSVAFVAFALDAGTSRRMAILAGVTAALLLAVGFESLHIFVMVSAFLLLKACFDPVQNRAAGLAFLAMALTLAAIFVGTVPPAVWLTPHCDALAVNSFAAVMIAALGAAVTLALGPRVSLPVRLLLVAATCLVAGAVFLAIDPVCRSGPLAELDQRLKPLWLDSVREAQPISTLIANPGKAIGFFIIPLLGVAAAVAAFIRRRMDLPLLLVLGLVLASLVLACLQIRFITYAGWFGALLAVVAWSRLLPGTQIAAILLRLAIVALLPLAIVLLGDTFAQKVESANGAAAPAVYEACNDTRSLAAIAALPKGTVLSHIDLGSYLLARTPHDVIMAPYHRAASAIVFGQTAFMGAESAAKNAILAYPAKIDYIVDCAALGSADSLLPKQQENFRQRLLAGERLDWLEKIAMPEKNPLLVWRVLR